PPESATSDLQRRVIEDVLGGDLYAPEPDLELTKDQLEILSELSPESLLAAALEGDIIDLRAVKFVLGLFAALKTTEPLEAVVGNLERLAPASPAVARYLRQVSVDAGTAKPAG